MKTSSKNSALENIITSVTEDQDTLSLEPARIDRRNLRVRAALRVGSKGETPGPVECADVNGK